MKTQTGKAEGSSYNNALLVIGALTQKQVTRSLFQKVLWVLVPVSGESCAFWCLESALGLFSASYIYCICQVRTPRVLPCLSCTSLQPWILLGCIFCCLSLLPVFLILPSTLLFTHLVFLCWDFLKAFPFSGLGRCLLFVLEVVRGRARFLALCA